VRRAVRAAAVPQPSAADASEPDGPVLGHIGHHHSTRALVLDVLTGNAVADPGRRRVQGRPNPADAHNARVRLIGGTNLDDVQAAFAQTRIDHVIMGAGIDLEARLEIIREIFQRSDTTTVHMKDRATGPDGFLPFIAAVLRGLDDYQIR
jgi:hypothetical protein